MIVVTEYSVALAEVVQTHTFDTDSEARAYIAARIADWRLQYIEDLGEQYSSMLEPDVRWEWPALWRTSVGPTAPGIVGWASVLDDEEDAEEGMGFSAFIPNDRRAVQDKGGN